MTSPPKYQNEEELPLDDVIDFLNKDHIDLDKISSNHKPNM
jgi:hypothetical protein